MKRIAQLPPRISNILLGIMSVMTLAFLLLPVFVVMPISFSSGSFISYPVPGFSVRWYAQIFTPGPWTFALGNSLYVAGVSACAATLLGTSAAIGLNRLKIYGKGLISSALVLPLATPVVITALAIYFWLAKIGLLYSFTGLIIAHTMLGSPFVVVIVTSTLRGFDWSLFRAAASLGASNIIAIRTVMLPLIAPGLISGWIFAFMASFDDVVVALFIAGPKQFTFPRQLFSGLRDHLDPSIIAAATLLTMIMIGLMGFAEWMRHGLERRRHIELQ